MTMLKIDRRTSKFEFNSIGDEHRPARPYGLTTDGKEMKSARA